MTMIDPREPSDFKRFPPQDQEPPGLTGPMRPAPDHGEDSYEGRGRLTGMRTVITGGDSGIGRAVAIAYAREGAHVVIGAMEEEREDAEDTAAIVRAAGVEAHCIYEDLTTRSACHALIDGAVQHMGGIDVLVNNAGFHWSRTNTDITDLLEENVERVIRTNLTAVIWLTQRAVPHIPPGGSIINTSSIQANDPSENLLDYAATKAAINNLTVNLAAQLGDRGIRCNAIAPGPIWTPLQPATRAEDDYGDHGAGTPLGRAGHPSELAHAYVFFASPREASYISGTVLGITGGRAVF